QPSPVEDNVPAPESDSEEVADWFSTETDPAIVQAVAKAEADARKPVEGTFPVSSEQSGLSQ
ncbi:MAG: SPFH/Band 7/PHB domain protein, partial [Mycobacterium sp.]|nr:SPFH/Band 7/PHB domain protein [Mycobacterium sp.]